MSFPVAKPTPAPTPAAEKPAKPKFPLSNAVDCDSLRSYFLNPSVEVLLLDVRPEEEFQHGYVGVEYEPRGVKIDIVWLDPTVVMRDGYVGHPEQVADTQDGLDQTRRRSFPLARKATQSVRE
jgi:ubiquitin carboxyl-terminal hydrolase 8